MSYATIDDLRSQLGARPVPEASAAYAAKMLHPFPDGPIVDRPVFVLERCTGKRVLEFGASGPLHEAIHKAASASLGVDRSDGAGVVGFDLDDVTQKTLPAFDPDVIICGEVLEHLSNAGWFLTRLRRQYAGVPVVVTVPNALSSIAQKQLARGLENCNIDHVCWFSPRTLRTLVERAGYVVRAWAYYNGDGPSAEGIVAVMD